MSVERAPATTQLLAGAPGTLSLTLYRGGVVVDPGTVTVTVTRADGTALVTDAPTSGSGAAARSLALDATQTAAVDLLSVTWTAVGTDAAGSYGSSAEIVGDLLFTIQEARTFRAELNNIVKYPDTAIEAARAEVLDQFEDIMGVAPCPRYRRAVLDGTTVIRHGYYHHYAASYGRGTMLALPDMLVTAIRSVETRSGTAWTAYDQAQLDDLLVDASGLVVRDSWGVFPPGRQNIRISYVCGFARVPLDIRRAALLVAADRLVPSNVYNRATTVSDDTGTYIMATPGMRGSWFGLPAADEVVNRYREQYYVPRIG